jgi:4-hydroxythreonine-4-phosphate dehydrogenase
LAFYRKALSADHFNYTSYRDKVTHKKVNVVNCWEDMLPIDMGMVTESGGMSAYRALECAVRHLKEGVIDAVVTAPINKHNIQNADFRFAGHTEYFSAQFGAKESLMFMVSENLRIGVATGHMPVKDISTRLTHELLTSKLSIMVESLKEDFAIAKPRVAVLGLNPHAGEEGLLGTEEQEIIQPVISDFKRKGNLMFGPFPADGFFGKGEYKKFDGIMAMYHDQGLIPFKTLSFSKGVNFTAGLPIVRTSPDHGTAYPLAGKNEASYDSMQAAIFMAMDILKSRMEIIPAAVNE